MLRSKMIFALAFLSAAPVAAESPVLVGQTTFEGRAVEHKSRLGAGDVIHIDGAFVSGGETFSFTVNPTGAVRGTVGRTPVSYRVSRAERDRLAKAIAAQAEPEVAEAVGGKLASAR